MKAKRNRRYFVKHLAHWCVYDREVEGLLAAFKTRAQAYWYAKRLNTNKVVK